MFFARVCKQINRTELTVREFLLCAFANVLRLTGTTRVIDTPPNVRPVTGKSMRHALRTWFRDSTARRLSFLSLTPSFRRKERKMPCELLFRPRRSYPRPPAQLFFTQLLIVFGGIPYIPPPNPLPPPHTHTHTRVSATLASSPLERTSEILSFSTALFSLEIMCLLLRSHVARHRRGVSRFLYNPFYSGFLLTLLFFFLKARRIQGKIMSRKCTSNSEKRIERLRHI